MSNINDGGPAFPHDNQVCGNGHRMARPGMTLRQWYAGQALAGIMADSQYAGTSADFAECAFRFADAMLAHEAAEREAK